MRSVSLTDALTTREAWLQAFEDREVYVKNTFAHVQRFGIHEHDFNLAITDLGYAMKRGKECRRWIIHGHKSAVISMLAIANWSLLKLFEVLSALELERAEYRKLQPHLSVSVYHFPSKEIFSPMALSATNPLAGWPQKWTVPHLVRLLARDQSLRVVCEGQTTDDSFLDSERNFNRGEEVDRLAFIRDLVEDAKSWSVRPTAGGLSVSQGYHVSYFVALSHVTDGACA